MSTTHGKALVTGSAGHLGEALMRTFEAEGRDAVGIDLQPSPYTSVVASVANPEAVDAAMEGVSVVYHTATLHKPHVATHTMQDFVDTNVSGTLTLLQAAVSRGVSAFVFTSTTSAFGAALNPPPGEPAAWITEDVAPIPKNIYGSTKTAAEDLCRLFHRQHGLPCLVLRTSRFFPEPDDDPATRSRYSDANVKAVELLYRRVDVADVVDAHRLAAGQAPRLGFGRYIISATTPFAPEDAVLLDGRAPEVVRRRVPEYPRLFEALGWEMFERIDRVYVNAAARRDLGWSPRYDFATVLREVAAGGSGRSALADRIGIKGYHGAEFGDGVYPTLSAQHPAGDA